MKKARRQLLDIGDHDELFGTTNSNIKFPLLGILTVTICMNKPKSIAIAISNSIRT